MPKCDANNFHMVSNSKQIYLTHTWNPNKKKMWCDFVQSMNGKYHLSFITYCPSPLKYGGSLKPQTSWFLLFYASRHNSTNCLNLDFSNTTWLPIAIQQIRRRLPLVCFSSPVSCTSRFRTHSTHPPKLGVEAVGGSNYIIDVTAESMLSTSVR